MKISGIVSFLETLAHPSLQEHYDNTGLITGDSNWECNGMVICLDTTEKVVDEAVALKCNLIVAHHPIIFGGLKKINGKNYVERTIIAAIKYDIAIYAIHTNLDNVIEGVSGKMAMMLGLQHTCILSQKENTLRKLFTFTPLDKAQAVRNAIFEAGGGQIGNYSECSFNAEGIGTFKGGSDASPYVGEIGKQHHEKEIKIEVVFPSFLQHAIVNAMKSAHPYEEVAYDVISLSNTHHKMGAGVVGELPEVMDEKSFLSLVKEVFKVSAIRHSPLLSKPIKNIALCGGAGSFLVSKAIAAQADAYITADIKYHEFFDADNRILIADIGHYESEQFTVNLLYDILVQKFPTFAILKTEVNTNPVRHFL